MSTRFTSSHSRRRRNPLAGDLEHNDGRIAPRSLPVITPADEARVEALLAQERRRSIHVPAQPEETLPPVLEILEAAGIQARPDAVRIERVDLPAPSKPTSLECRDQREFQQKEKERNVPLPRRGWTERQDQEILREWNEFHLTFREIAIRHGRSHKAVKERLWKLRAHERS